MPRFRVESRLKAVDMQLNSANSQISSFTENEAKLCDKNKELQLKTDELQFEQERKRTVPGVLNHSSLGNLISNPTPHHPSHKTRDKKHDKRDKKEKDMINKIFSSQIRSSEKKGDRVAASTPRSDKSDTTIKFTENQEISKIQDQTF